MKTSPAHSPTGRRILIGGSLATIAVIAGSFWTSAVHLVDIAERYGVHTPTAYTYPIIIDGMAIAGALLALHYAVSLSSMRGPRFFAYALVYIAAAASIVSNVWATPIEFHGDPVAMSLYGFPPLFLTLTWHALMALVHAESARAGAVAAAAAVSAPAGAAVAPASRKPAEAPTVAPAFVEAPEVKAAPVAPPAAPPRATLPTVRPEAPAAQTGLRSVPTVPTSTTATEVKAAAVSTAKDLIDRAVRDGAEVKARDILDALTRYGYGDVLPTDRAVRNWIAAAKENAA